MKKLLSAVFSLIMLLTPVTTWSSQEVDREKMSKEHQKVYDASLALYGTLGDISHFLCTSTVVARRASTDKSKKYEYLLLTAGHCIVGEDLPDNLSFSVADKIVPEDDTKDRQPVDVVVARNDLKYDFAILYLATDKEYPVIPIANRIPDVEDRVYAVNYSLGIGKQVALGVVATKVLDDPSNVRECDICKGRYMVHLFAAGGASGSAIVDEKTNEIVGVGEFGFPGTTTGLGCETTPALLEFLKNPLAAAYNLPKAPSLQNNQAQNGK